MAWRLASRLARFRAIEEAPLTASDEPIFPAGVVALGRGGAGEVGALLRTDGLYIGLLRLSAPPKGDRMAIDALAATLPTGRCQILTLRWPIDADRAATNWRAPGRRDLSGAALARAISTEYLPDLVDAGWSEVHTYLTIEGVDPESVLHDLYLIAAELPLPTRPATLAEAKQIAGDWYTPRSHGLITIGWSLTELTAEPQPAWAAHLLELPALAALPTLLTLHLEPIGAPAPISLELHRRLAAIDGEIEARRRAGRRGGLSECDDADDLLAERRELLTILAESGGEGERPRLARLLIACTVEPQGARALRADVEAALQECGFLATSFGPGRSDDTLLSCAPLHAPQLGHSLMLTQRGAAVLSPIAPAMPGSEQIGPRTVGLPLGLRRDGAAVAPLAGESLLTIGDDTDPPTLLQTWVLGQVAAGAAVMVIDTAGRWGGIARAVGGEQIRVALELGALLHDLGAAHLRRGDADATRQIAPWADRTIRLLTDLCPDLGEDECGDLTATLMSLAEAELAWGEPVRLHTLIERLRESDSEPARHLATLLTATGGLHPVPHRMEGDSGLVILDAAPEPDGRRVVADSSCAAVALHAALTHLATLPSNSARPRLLVIDDLTALGRSSVAPHTLTELFAAANTRGITVWSNATSLATVPGQLVEALCGLEPTAILAQDSDEAIRLTARALGLDATTVAEYRALQPGEVLLTRGDATTPLRPVPLRLPPYTLRR